MLYSQFHQALNNQDLMGLSNTNIWMCLHYSNSSYAIWHLLLTTIDNFAGAAAVSFLVCSLYKKSLLFRAYDSEHTLTFIRLCNVTTLT